MTPAERKLRTPDVEFMIKDCHGDLKLVQKRVDAAWGNLLSEIDRKDAALRKIIKSLDVLTFDGPSPIVIAYQIASEALGEEE
jgi:hypothetical protein